MPESNVSFKLSFTESEARVLEHVFGLRSPTIKLRDVCLAAAEEYVRMILGQKSLSRGTDILEYRLLLLMRHAFEGEVPPDNVVEALFQVTPARARNLVSTVVAKYRHELEASVRTTLRAVLEEAEKDGEDFLIHSRSEPVLRLLSERVRWLEGTHQKLKRTARAGEYRLAPSVRDALLKELNG